jgi:hypothetical protein
MNHQRTLRQLIDDSLYVIDPESVADAILSRARAKAAMPDVAFRNDRGARAVRSFRLEHAARSFRLSSAPRQRQPQH